MAENTADINRQIQNKRSNDWKQSVDEIIEIDGIDEELAGIIIMEARADWFKDDQNND